jgi:hypothetical protein
VLQNNNTVLMSVNLKIILDLKTFILESSTNDGLRKLFTSSPTDFTRNRKLGFEPLVYLLINFMRKSYNLEIATFYEHINSLETKVSKSAFCQQRMKINALFFACLNEVLVHSFYEHYGETIKRWKGFRLIAVDGSTSYLIHNKEVVDYFGEHPNQVKSVCMGQIVSAFDVLNGITILSDLYPTVVSEQRVAQCWINHYDADMLMLYDRGYPGFTSIFLHQHKEIPQPFVMRCPLAFTYEIRDFVSSTLEETVTHFRATKYAVDELYKQGYKVLIGSTIEVRLVKVVLDDGTIEVLATNLMDNVIYPHQLFKELYFKRWGIETQYDTIKNKLQLEAYSGQKPVTILQDFHIAFFLANLQEIISKPCQIEIEKSTAKRKFKYKINKSMALGLMKNRIIDLFINRNPEQILHQLQQLFILYLEPERPNRKYLHKRKSGKPKGKYQALSNFKQVF